MPGRTGPRPDTETAHLNGRVAAMMRWGAPPEKLEDVRRELRAAKLAAHVQEVVATFPPLRVEQLERIVAILRAAPTHSTECVATHSACDAAAAVQ